MRRAMALLSYGRSRSAPSETFWFAQKGASIVKDWCTLLIAIKAALEVILEVLELILGCEVCQEKQSDD
jgi:hypothetical protein